MKKPFHPALRLLAVFGVMVTGISVVGASILHAAGTSDACKLLMTSEILKATGLTVGDGTAGRPIPGVLGRCTWVGSGNTKVIVTLTDAQHMETTIAVQQKEGTSVPGVGSKAVAIKSAGFTGGGYILSFLDAQGGIGVSILGKDGTLDRVVALAKVVESHR